LSESGQVAAKKKIFGTYFQMDNELKFIDDTDPNIQSGYQLFNRRLRRLKFINIVNVTVRIYLLDFNSIMELFGNGWTCSQITGIDLKSKMRGYPVPDAPGKLVGETGGSIIHRLFGSWI